MSDTSLDRAFQRCDHGLVHYRERPADAEASQPPLLLLHASPSCSRSLAPIMAADTSGRRLLAPDTPGNGDSCPLAEAAPDIGDYARAMDAFCEALGLGAVDVFGSHTGAHIAIELAALVPSRVRRIAIDGLLVLDNSERRDFLAHYAPPKIPDELGSQFHWAWQYIRDQMIFFPHFRKDREHLRGAGVFDPALLHELTLDVLRSLETYHLSYEAVFRHDVSARVAAPQCPIRWLDSGEDYQRPGIELLSARAQQPSIVPVTHAPATVAAALEAFSMEP